MDKIKRSFIMIYFATVSDVVSSTNIFECRCYRDVFGREAPEGCHGYNSMTNSTYTMTTANCSLTVSPEVSNTLTDFTLSVDIGLDCNPAGLPLQFCESAECRVSYSDIHTDLPIFFDFPFRYEVHLKGILILSTNGTDGTAMDMNREYKLNLSCKTADVLLLEKNLHVVFTSIPITGSVSAKSTKHALPNVGGHNTVSATVSTTPVETTINESWNSSYPTTPAQIITQKSYTRDVPDRKTYTSVTTASIIYSAQTETLRPPLTSIATILASDTTPSLVQSDLSFFDDPINKAAVSVVGGVALLSAASVGISLLVLKLGKRKQVTPRKNDDSEGEND